MRFLRFVGAMVPPVLRDGIGLAGAASFTYGAWLIYEPAGFMVGGVLLVATAVLLAGRSA
jgi:hypothetical protein